ncbi:uncharacterized protein LOC119068331 [Bradysia coprophila]|uniref:uncharacterized protein LOC119068331 n=1 Tax=Bradysia coprophila TaxID=38358 RepID=UPI00187D7E58|nr:uncharacterized protein LOC119068331 [Bradysia coprophila]
MDKRTIGKTKDGEAESSSVLRRKRPNADNNVPTSDIAIKRAKRIQSVDESSSPDENMKPNASLMEANASLMEANASLMEANASLMEANASVMEPNTSVMEPNASLMEANASLMELHASLIQNDDPKMKSIGDLPTEMIQAILEKLPTLELFKCRLMNHQWNKIASKIIRQQRTDVELEFRFNKGNFVQTIKCRRCEVLLVNLCKTAYRYGTKNLTNLLACISEDFPYANFRFDDLEEFANEDMQKFLSVWGKNIRVLNVNMRDSPISVSHLRELLFHKVTNLKKLELTFCKDDNVYTHMKKTPSSFQIVDGSGESKLPHLDVLCVNIRFNKFHSIVANILSAASNLKVFEILKESTSNPYFGADCVHEDRIVTVDESVSPDDLAMLQLHNKLHCVKKLELFVSEGLIAYWETSVHTMDDLKLESLAFALSPTIWENEQMKRRATSVINQLLRSSKDSLVTLSIEPVGSLPDLVIPKLEKLMNLDLCGFTQREDVNASMFPSSFEMADMFPNVKELDMHFLRHDEYFHSPKPFKTMASLEVLRIYGSKLVKRKEKLIKATPNVTTLLLVEDEFPWTANVRLPVDFQKITTNLPKLESLGLLICRPLYSDLLYKLDAVITGLPEKFCKELSKKFRTKNHLSPDEIAMYESRREKASILDLKALKQLDVSFFFDFDCYCDQVSSKRKVDEAGYTPDDNFYETGFTKVSEFLAFNLMPDLKVRQHKRME